MRGAGGIKQEVHEEVTVKIAVFGGTGFLGVPVSRHLQEAGHEVRVVTRNADKARQSFDDSFEIAQADPETGEGVVEAVSGCDGAHISIWSDTEVECVRSIVGAAREAGVKRLVYVSGVTAIPANTWFPMVAAKVAAEEVLRGSGMPWTVLAPGWFFDMLERFVRGGKAAVLGDNPTPYHFVSRDDFARMVRQAFELSEAVNRRFVVKGPEGITIKDALRRYLEVRHPEIDKIGQPPIWLLRLIATLSRNQEMKFGIKLMRYFMKVGEPGDPTDTNELFGAPQTTLDEWLATP